MSDQTSNPGTPPLTGELVKLRPFLEQDFDWYWGLRALPEMWRYTCFWVFDDEATTRQVFNSMLPDAPHYRPSYFSVLESFANSQPAGFAKLSGEFDQTADLGWYLRPEYWGKGFATEATDLILGFAFSDARLHRVQATCDPNNLASKRVLEKSGLTYEGTIRHFAKHEDGSWRDRLLYSILEGEWRGK